MKKYITSEIDAVFLAIGCSPMLNKSATVDYWHNSADLYLRYSPTLKRRRFQAQINDTEVVIVVPNDAAVALPMSGALPCEVVRLKDLPEFLAYRTLGEECFEYRKAKLAHVSANANFSDAYDRHKFAHSLHKRAVKKFSKENARLTSSLEEFKHANDVHTEATARFFLSSKPPRFSPVAN